MYYQNADVTIVDAVYDEDELPVGTKLKIGDTVQEVTQIGKECHSGCAIAQSVGKCVMPKEGIFTKVLKAGKVKVGDTIEEIE